MTIKQKDKYRTRNWKEYNQSLVNRGSITFWFDDSVIENWYSSERTSKPGRPEIYSDDAIRCSLMIKAVFHTTLRSLQGFLTSLISLLGVNLKCPHYSVFCRRAKNLQIPLRKLLHPGEKLNVIFDSTGVKIFGEGEWKVRALWKKEVRYHRRSRIETLMFRYKTLMGEKLSSRKPWTQSTEVTIKLDVLNKMMKLGMPKSYRVEA